MKYFIFVFILHLSLYASAPSALYQYIEPITVEEAPVGKKAPVLKVDKDLDKDGVLNEKDKCPATKRGTFVDINGCKVSTIVLLLENEKDHNAVVVATEAGESLIQKPNQFATITTIDDMPSEPAYMSPKEMNFLFGEMKSISPAKAQHFVVYFQGKEFVESSQEKMKKIIDDISKRDDVYIKIIGHTDSIGSFAANDRLAKARAQKVADIIKASNVKYQHMSVASYGEHNLAIKTGLEAIEPLNRRVEILIR